MPVILTVLGFLWWWPIGLLMLGFWIARRLPVWASVTLVVTLEVAVGIIIRDNLALNILMLIHPVEAIRHWQLGG